MFILSIVVLSIVVLFTIIFMLVVGLGDQFFSLLIAITSLPCLVLSIIPLIGGFIDIFKRRPNLKRNIITTILSANALGICLILEVLAIFYFAVGSLPTPSLFGW